MRSRLLKLLTYRCCGTTYNERPCFSLVIFSLSLHGFSTSNVVLCNASATVPSSLSAPRRNASVPYVFPVGRVLRYIQLGKHYYSRSDGAEQTVQLLRECAQAVAVSSEEQGCVKRGEDAFLSFLPNNRSGGDLEENEMLLCDVTSEAIKEGSTTVTPSFSCIADMRIPEDEAVEERLPLPLSLAHTSELDEARLAALERFIHYHAHHVIVNFKSERAAWMETSRQRSLQQQPRLSPEAVARAVDFTFYVSSLLHLTALFGFGEKYIEPLLAVALSATVFLSQSSNQARYALAGASGGIYRHVSDQYPTISRNDNHSNHRQRHLRHHRVRRHEQQKCVSVLGTEADAITQWTSLYWAVEHFCSAVKLWELCRYTGCLFQAEKTYIPFVRLLRFHAATLLELGDGSYDHRTWHALLALRSGHSSPKQRGGGGGNNIKSGTADMRRGALCAAEQWFYPPPAYTELQCSALEADGGVDDEVLECTHSRRLQLLPMLWLSMLSLHLLHTDRRCQTSHHPSSSTVNPQRGRAVTWGETRQAYVSLLSIFSTASDETGWAGVETSALALGHCLYHSSGHGGASVVQLAAMLSALETQGSSTDVVHFLDMWLCEKEKNCWVPTQQALAPPPRSIGSRDVYAALASVPLCTVTSSSQLEEGAMLDNEREAKRHYHRRARTDFVLTLLLRSLIQWPTQSSFSAAVEFPDSFCVSKAGAAAQTAYTRHQSHTQVLAVSAFTEELQAVLAAALRLQNLHRRATLAQNATASMDLAGSCVVAAMRALTSHVGWRVLPSRVWLMRGSRVAVTRAEMHLLHALSDIATDVLEGVVEQNEREDATHISIGAIPPCFTEGIAALLHDVDV